MKDIPENIDWVIRVDGHTDNTPCQELGEFKDNWELSQARAPLGCQIYDKRS